MKQIIERINPIKLITAVVLAGAFILAIGFVSCKSSLAEYSYYQIDFDVYLPQSENIIHRTFYTKYGQAKVEYSSSSDEYRLISVDKTFGGRTLYREKYLMKIVSQKRISKIEYDRIGQDPKQYLK